MVIAIYQKSLFACLGIACLCGVLPDLLMADKHLGLYALNFCLTTGALYPLRRIFFADKVSTLPMMTFIWSFLGAINLIALLYIFEGSLLILTSRDFVDLCLFPLLTGAYAHFVVRPISSIICYAHHSPR